MKAVVIREAGGPEVLEIQERVAPPIGPGLVRVKVGAVGINRADLIQRRGGYPAPSGVPADIPGLEFAGTVSESAADTVAVGARVMGLVAGAGYAEEVVVHHGELLTIPEHLSVEEAAAIPEVFLTAFDALTQLGVSAGERVLVHAVGSGVGTAALQLCNLIGATPIGTSRTAEKLEKARTLGLALGVPVTDPKSFAGEATSLGAIDAVVDLVGGAYFEQTLACLGQRGRLLIVGLTAGAKAELNLAQLLRNRINVRGTNLRSRGLDEKIALVREFERRILPAFSTGRLQPIVDRSFSMEEVVAAHGYVESNANFGKVILRW